ncbi:MAG TPA: amidohydrolase family protein [Rhodothermia bacterium]|nr:amidohydrolase family protein [Rhodothermia bacterium]
MHRNLSRSLAAVMACASFTVSALAQGGGEGCDNAPDVIYHNGTVLTMDDALPQAEAMAVRGDAIMAVGSSEQILAMQGDDCGTLVANLDGLTILPGFNDSHSHWFSWREHICSVTEETTYPSLEEIMEMLSRNGWTSIAELNFGRPDFAPEHLDNALDLSSRGELSVRLNGYWGTYDDVSMIDVLAAAGRTRSTFYADRVRAPGVKFYVDNPFGEFDLLTQDEVNQLVAKAHNAGWAVAAHAVNQSGVEKILTAFENVLGAGSNASMRHRIEHAVKVSDNQLGRMKQKGIITSFQLLGPADWPAQSDFADRFLGSNPQWVMRWQDFVEAESGGLKITGSTDAPFNDAPCNYSPFEIVYQAVTRDGYVDRTPAAWELDQRISTEDALRLLTIDGAYATSEESMKGSLAVGKWADFVLVSANPLAVSSPEDLRDIEVYMTVVGGETEYCNESAASQICAPTETFVVDAGVVSASRYLPDQTPDFAFDGDLGTNWGAGDFPPQWIRIDLGEPVLIAGIDLVVEQFPAGHTVHTLWAKTDPAAEFEQIHSFVGTTESDQVLSYDAPDALPAHRVFEIRTALSLSWVAWKEITIRKASGVSVEDDPPGVPSGFSLNQNYPNPFNPSTTITFELAEKTAGDLEIFDVFGRRVRTWSVPAGNSGIHTLTWDGTDETGNVVAGGVYLYRLTAGEFEENRRMVLLK